MPQPKSYSLRVDITAIPEQTHFVDLFVQEGTTIGQHHTLRVDMLYEQIQTLVDNKLRRVVNELSTTLREERKKENR